MSAFSFSFSFGFVFRPRSFPLQTLVSFLFDFSLVRFTDVFPFSLFPFVSTVQSCYTYANKPVEAENPGINLGSSKTRGLRDLLCFIYI